MALREETEVKFDIIYEYSYINILVPIILVHEYYKFSTTSDTQNLKHIANCYSESIMHCTCMVSDISLCPENVETRDDKC